MIETRTLCLNQSCYVHQYLTEPLSVSVLEWLNGQDLLPKFYWKGSDGQERAGCGAVLALDEVPHFDSANDSPARLWGGRAFDRTKHIQDSLWSSFPYCRFFLPQLEVVKEKDKCTLIINALNGPVKKGELLPPEPFSRLKKKSGTKTSFPNLGGWTNLIEDLLKEIDEGTLSKVVMARHSVQKTAHTLNAFEHLAHLNVSGATLFAFQFTPDAVFIGATPERLYDREKNTITVDAVAGTRKRGQSGEEDEILKEDLLKNPKEKREFEFVKLSIKDALYSLCESFSCQPQNNIIKTPYVQHLYNRFEGVLKSNVGDDQIIDLLHPTAALGGYPRQLAYDYLLKTEPFNRGWYASPIGFVSQQKATLVVAIRSALVQPHAFHTFAGAGIVDGSVAASEWEELEHKESLWTKI